MKISIVASLILAVIATIIISNRLSSGNTLEKILKNVEITDLNGETLNKNDLNGKVIILSYFQTWCSDCAKEQPELQKLKEKFGNDLKILIVSDEEIEKIVKFREMFHSPLDFYHSVTPLKKNRIVRKFPTTYLTDKNGNIETMKVEGIHWYTPETIATIEQMLAR